MTLPSPSRRVAFILDSSEPSGVGEHLCTLAPLLARRGYAVHLVCRSERGVRRFRERWTALGLPLSTVPEPNAASEPAFRRLVALLRALRPDVAHFQLGIGWEIGRAPQAAAAAGVPVRLSTEHLPYLLDDPADIELHTAACATLNALVTVSDGVRQSFLDRGFPASLVRAVHNGIDLARFATLPSRSDARRRLKLPLAAPVVLHVARFTEQKGHRALIAAVHHVARAIPAVRFLLVGDGPLWEDIHATVVDLRLHRHIRFLRRRRAIRLLLAAADLLVLPSLFEGHPLVVLEALAAGVPVVGTAVCGTTEAVEHGVTGWLVPPQDPLAMADALIHLLNDTATRQSIAHAGRAQAAARFSADRMADDFGRVYATLLAAQSSYAPAPTHASAVRHMETL